MTPEELRERMFHEWDSAAFARRLTEIAREWSYEYPWHRYGREAYWPLLDTWYAEHQTLTDRLFAEFVEQVMVLRDRDLRQQRLRDRNPVAGDYGYATVALAHARVSFLMRHPRFMAETGRFVQGLLMLVGTGAYMVSDAVFQQYEASLLYAGDFRPDADLRLLPTAREFLYGELYWVGGFLHGELLPLFRGIAKLLAHLAQQFPQEPEVLELQVQFLRRAAQREVPDGWLNYRAVTVWDTELRRVALEALIRSEPGTPAAKMAYQILDGQFDGIGEPLND